MKKLVIIGVSILSLAALTAVYNQDNFSARGRMFQPPPEGHVVGKDNGPGFGLHHAGEECGMCHGMGGQAGDAYVWTAAGTIYADRAGREVLKGAEIILQDRDGKVISLTSNEAGNFWTTTPIASNPYTVVDPSTPLYGVDDQGNFKPAPPDDPRTWLYKTWVRKGASVRPMVTIGPVASTSGMVMSCNMHHGPASSSRGALWVAPPGQTPPAAFPGTGLSYRRHIHSIVRGQCSPCHIPGNAITRHVTKTDLDTPSTDVDYSAGMDLMTYGGSNVGGFNKKGIADPSLVNVADPDQSLLLLKPSGAVPHAGGVFWDEKSPYYLALKQWIAEGALNN